MFLETIAAMILALPVLIEISKIIQIDPVHFGTIVVINLSIGLATPPVGVCLFIASGIAKQPIEKVSLAMLPMLAIAIGDPDAGDLCAGDFAVSAVAVLRSLKTPHSLALPHWRCLTPASAPPSIR